MRTPLLLLALSIAAPASAQVVINEVVVDPASDWNDGSFDATPGGGVPGDGDEWIELFNSGITAVDLSGWYLVMTDSGGAVTTYLATCTAQAVSGGSVLASVAPGGYFVCGDPDGAMDNAVTIELHNVAGGLVDQVVIGTTGAPGYQRDGVSTGPGDESIHRVPNGTDTGDDAKDFAKGTATFLGPNGSGQGAAGSVVINEVVTDPQRDWSDSSGGIGAPFDATPGSGLVDLGDEYVELANTGSTVLDLTDWRLEMTDATPAGDSLGFGAATLRFSSGCSLAAFGAACRAVLGNPTGAMDANVYLQLRDASEAVIDDVELGSDPEGDGTTDGARSGAGLTLADEAASRLPDRRDTGVDPADFDRTFATPLAANPVSTGVAGAVVINEVVTDPQADWNDALAFDATPGSGTVTADDEWVELLSVGPGTSDLRGWKLWMTDPTEELQAFGYTVGPDVVTSCTVAAMAPGCRLVLGNPAGAMDDNLALRLVDPGGKLIDAVELGSDPERDGTGDGAPSGAATGSADEAVARSPDGRDSDLDGGRRGPPACTAASCPDRVDFIRTVATIQAINPERPDGGADAGTDGGVDAGTGADAGGGDGGIVDAGPTPDAGSSDAGGTVTEPPPQGCGCTQTGGSALTLLLLVAFGLRRRERAS